MYLRNCWYVAGWTRELDNKSGLLARTILDEPVVLCRMGDGTLAAFTDRCPHRRLPLSAGTITTDGIRCGYHGLEFDRAGVCIRIPGQDSIPLKPMFGVTPWSKSGDGFGSGWVNQIKPTKR